MKRIVAIFTLLILLVLALNINIVKATDTSTATTVNLTFESEVQDDQVIITIKLGDFSGVTEGETMAADVTIDFDENHIDTIQGESYDGWTVTVSAETKKVLFETDTAYANTTIGIITFNLDSSSITEETTGIVAVTELNISNGSNLDETYTGPEVTYTLTPSTGSDNTDDDTTANLVVNTVTDDETNTLNIVDNTLVTESKLPQTGISVAVAIAIVAVILLAVLGMIRYKSIKIK